MMNSATFRTRLIIGLTVIISLIVSILFVSISLIVINRTHNQPTTFVQKLFSSTYQTTDIHSINTEFTATLTSTSITSSSTIVSKCTNLFKRVILNRTMYSQILVNKLSNSDSARIFASDRQGSMDVINIYENGTSKTEKNVINIGLQTVLFVNDLNMDGTSDMISWNQRGYQVDYFAEITIWLGSNERNQLSLSSSIPISYVEEPNYKRQNLDLMTIIGADLDNDNDIDLIISNHPMFGLGIILGYWNRYFQRNIKVISSSNNLSYPIITAANDLNNDNNIDIIIYNRTGKILVLFGYGNGNFQKPILSFAGVWRNFVIKDLNNDNLGDIIGIDENNFCLDIYIGINDGTFLLNHKLYTSYKSNPHSIAFIHLNNDNQIDICVTNSNLNSIDLFIGHNNGTFSLFTMLSVIVEGPTSIFAADLNNDNRQDLVVLTPINLVAFFRIC